MEYTKTTYRGYTIEWDADRSEHIAYPAEEGIQHDYDQDGDSTRYCGNCLWSRDMESLHVEIDDKIITGLEADVKQANKVIDKQRDQLAIARQCIDACKQEFQYRLNKLYQCPDCKGEGFSEVDGNELPIDCPPCKGNGMREIPDAVIEHNIQICQTALENTK